MSTDLMTTDLINPDLINPDLIYPDLSRQDLLNKIGSLEYTINQLYNKNYYLMEIMSDKEIKFHELQCELYNKINLLTEELKSYKIPISKLAIEEELRDTNIKVNEKEYELREKEQDKDVSTTTSVVTNIIDTKNTASWSGIVSGREQPIKEIVKTIPDLSNSTIISAKVGDYNMYPNALKWKSLHIYICKNVINQFSIDYLIKHSSMKIIKNDPNVRGYVRRLRISIQYTDTQSTYKDINYLLTKINKPLELTVKLSNDSLYTF